MIDLPTRLLMGAGPSPVPGRVLEALAAPTVGHLDPVFGDLLDEVGAGLRELFRTDNPVTFPLSGTGSAGMDAVVTNFVRPGDRVVCGVSGLFGERLAEALGRQGAEVVRVDGPWGRALDVGRVRAAVTAAEPSAVFLVHGETSTGVAQPLDGIAEDVHAVGGLLVLDCVTSLAGHPLRLDEAGADVAFSGTQKCLNVPPGLAPLSVGPRALAASVDPSRSWYFDVGLLRAYWEGRGGRVYHHTAPINLVYALREGVRAVLEEGLTARWERHATAHAALRDALSVLGLERLAPEGEHLAPLLCVEAPEDEAAVRGALLEEDGIEISPGAGRLAGHVWRVGVMGEGARPEPQERLIGALAPRLGRDPGEALAALRAGWSDAGAAVSTHQEGAIR